MFLRTFFTVFIFEYNKIGGIFLKTRVSLPFSSLMFFLLIGFILISGCLEDETVNLDTLNLSDIPEVFSDDVLIVIGDNVSELEKRVAEDVESYFEDTFSVEPTIKSYLDVSYEDKVKNNLIVIGTPQSNGMLLEIYGLTDAVPVTDTFPGKRRGILEILSNPWNEKKSLLLIQGNDDFGVKAGYLELLRSKEYNEDRKITSTLIEITKCKESSPIFVILPVTIPIEDNEEILELIEACTNKDFFNVGKEPMNITLEGNEWIISEVNPSLGHPTWEITINKTTGKTECSLYF
ncbi:hypothetical protein MSMTP_0981 [Methanosarcina sp. MTP4]|nr:hypothetical protein MSMTP_0981 [Methanosarcina sp. MTP4]